MKKQKLNIFFLFITFTFLTSIAKASGFYYDDKLYYNDLTYDKQPSFTKGVYKSRKVKKKSIANGNLKRALGYKYKLSSLGINYTPWKDRLDNDIILMRKLLSVKSSGDNRFDDYQIISTKGKTFVNNKKKLVFVNYRTTSSELEKFIFSTNNYSKKYSKESSKKNYSSKSKNYEKSKSKSKVVKQKSKGGGKFKSNKVEIANVVTVKTLVPVKKIKRSQYSNAIYLKPKP